MGAGNRIQRGEKRNHEQHFGSAFFNVCPGFRLSKNSFRAACAEDAVFQCFGSPEIAFQVWSYRTKKKQF
eukprot:12181008-Heterocapsa_arctica.AAC.1